MAEFGKIRTRKSCYHSPDYQRGGTMNESAITWVIEWLWVPLWVAVGELFRRFFSVKEDVAVLKAAEVNRDKQHEETLDALKNHHSAVITAVGSLTSQVATNGKRIGSIETHLRNGKSGK